jgi:uncharacterized protein YndB with AHSA1/START domain
VERVDEARAVVPGPPERVFAALTDGAARAAWLPPDGMTAEVEQFDARPGGGYRMVLSYDDPSVPGKSGAGRDVVEVAFVEVVAPVRVVEAVEFGTDDPALTGTMTMTWSIAAHPDGSLVTVTARDVPPGIDHDVHEAAFRSTLGHLADHLRVHQLRDDPDAEPE